MFPSDPGGNWRVTTSMSGALPSDRVSRNFTNPLRGLLAPGGSL